MKNLNEKKGSDWAAGLVEAARNELNANKGQWARLVDLSAGKLTYAWIAAFASRRIKMPHVDKIAELSLYLGIRLQAVEGNHFNKFQP